MEPVEHVEGEVALERRDAHGLDDATQVLERLGGRLHGSRHLGADRPEPGLDQPADPERSTRRDTHPRIELDCAGGEGVGAVGSGEK